MADKKKSKPAVKKPPVKSAKPAKPKKKKTPVGKTKSAQKSPSRGFTLSLKGDRSLQAYKNLVRGMIRSIVPDAKETWTEEEWGKNWKEFWGNVDRAAEKKKTKEADEEEKAFIEKWRNMSLEERYPGITEQIERFENAVLPPCPHCGSEDTASVQVGFIGRTMAINTATRKFRLVLNMSDKGGEYYCNKCWRFFD